MKSKSIVCMAFVVVLSSCEFDYSFQIVNLVGDTIHIEISENYTPIRRDQLKINPGKTVEIAHHTSGVVAWDYVPEDNYKHFPDKLLPPSAIVEMSIGDRLMSDSLRCRKYWDFSAKRLHGKYVLRLTEELIRQIE